jgi:hypothetical protein
VRTAAVVGSLLLLGSALAACGQGDDEAAEPVGGTSDGVRPALGLDLEYEEPLRAGAAVTWELTVSNDGADDARLTFTSGQSGDVVLVRDGEEAYRWSSGQMFTQAIREEVVPAGGSATFELDEAALDVEPGDYELRAELVGRPAPEVLTRAVTVQG